MKYRRGEQPNNLTAFHDALEQPLEAEARRPKHERRAAKALCAAINCAGYDGGYTRVTDFVTAWRQGEGQAASVNAFIPLAFEHLVVLWRTSGACSTDATRRSNDSSIRLALASKSSALCCVIR